MKLHYDYIMRHYSDRREIVDSCVKAMRLEPKINFDVIVSALESRGFFPAAAVTTALMTLHTIQGQQTFVVEEHLASMLEHTSLEGITLDELRLPYPTFYVALPRCQHRIWGGTRTQWHTVSGFYIHMDEEGLTVMAWAGENERSFGHGDDAHIWMCLHLKDQHRQQRQEDLESMILSLVNDKSNERNDPIIDPLAIIEGSQDDGVTDEVRAVQADTLLAMYRIAVNLAFYLSSPEAETESASSRMQELRTKLARAKSPGKRKKIQRQLDQCSKATVVHVGKNIEATAAEQVRQHGSVKAHWVRGHYHHYWTGKGRTTRVRRWLMPYPKGLEPPSKREYKIEGESTDVT